MIKLSKVLVTFAAILALALPGHAATIVSNQGSSAAAQNSIPKATDANGTQGASALSDDGTKVFTSENIDLVGLALVVEIANASSTGTTVNTIAKLTGAPSTVVIAGTSDTTGIGLVVGGAGTTGSAQIVVEGRGACLYDNNTVAGDYVSMSATNAGFCHDAGSTRPTSGKIVGRALTTTTVTVGTTTVSTQIYPPGIEGFVSSAPFGLSRRRR